MVMRSPCCYRLSVSLLLLLSVSPALGSEPPPADFRPDRIYEPEEDTGRADRVPPECAASPKLVIAVVGATGGVGKHVVSTALSQGHRVVALARSRANLTRLEEEIWRPKYTGNGNKFENLVIGNVDMHETTAERLGAALGANSVDLVLSCMGSTKGEEKVVAKATKKLLEACAFATPRVPRMAIISSVGIGDSWWQLLRFGAAGLAFSLILRTVLKETRIDLTAAEDECLQKAPEGVLCTVVRPAGLSNANATGDFDIADSSGYVGNSIARADVAAFMVSLAYTTVWDGKAVSVGGRAPPVP